jgi:hypothetical protein
VVLELEEEEGAPPILVPSFATAYALFHIICPAVVMTLLIRNLELGNWS